jgi:hypothetical protein
MAKHSKFINTPIIEILNEVTAICDSIGKNIEIFPVGEHILQSAFLKMTGFSEQKLKCILWDIATDDYEFRYLKFYSKSSVGECSSYSDKNTIYTDLLKQIKNFDKKFTISKEDKFKIKNETVKEFKEVISKSNISIWICSNNPQIRKFGLSKILNLKDSLNSNKLLSDDLQEIYKLLYLHRNRCAHNSTSYQENLPSLKKLISPSFEYDNYCIRFLILILLDKIFIYLYQKYQSVMGSSTPL